MIQIIDFHRSRLSPKAENCIRSWTFPAGGVAVGDGNIVCAVVVVGADVVVPSVARGGSVVAAASAEGKSFVVCA